MRNSKDYTPCKTSRKSKDYTPCETSRKSKDYTPCETSRKSKDYWFLYSPDMEIMAKIYAYGDFKTRLQSSDYCPGCRFFFLFENGFIDEPVNRLLLDEVMDPKYDQFEVYRAKEECLDDFLSDYWDGNVDWEERTIRIK